MKRYFTEETYRWQARIQKDVRHLLLLGKCKQKPQWGITAHLSGQQGCRETVLLTRCWWECKTVQPLWKTLRQLLKKNKPATTIWLSNCTAGHLSQRNETRSHKNLARMFIAVLFITAPSWKKNYMSFGGRLVEQTGTLSPWTTPQEWKGANYGYT